MIVESCLLNRIKSAELLLAFGADADKENLTKEVGVTCPSAGMLVIKGCFLELDAELLSDRVKPQSLTDCSDSVVFCCLLILF